MRKILVIFLLFLISGCDLFNTRVEEPPVKRGSTFIVPTIPEYVFTNLKNSLSEKVLENYMACFVDTAFLDKNYKYVPASGAVAGFQNLTEWDLNSERTYINNVFAAVQTSSITLRLVNENSTPQGDSAVYFYDYTLNIPVDNPEIPDTYRGSVQFTLSLDARNQWVITRWEDIQLEDTPSWSELRGRFY